MRPAFQFSCVLAVLLCLSAGFVAPCPAQTEFPACGKDGSPPAGESQCQCELRFHSGEYRDPEREYRERLPDGIVAVLGGCGPQGSLKISLTHPNGGEPGGDFPQNQVWVFGTKRRRETLAERVDGLAKNFAKTEREDAAESHATDVLIDQPVRTSLSSLTAIHLKASWTELDHGKLIYEAVIADNPKKEIVYEIGMISPAVHYKRNHELFKAVVEGFTFTPTEDLQEQ